MTHEDLATQLALFERVVLTRDAHLAGSVLDDDYALVLVQPTSAVMPRARWLEVLPQYLVYEYTVEEQHVHHDQDIATVLQRIRMTATVLGQDRSGLFVMSDIWRLRDVGWRVWHRHSTPLSAGPLPGR